MNLVMKLCLTQSTMTSQKNTMICACIGTCVGRNETVGLHTTTRAAVLYRTTVGANCTSVGHDETS